LEALELDHDSFVTVAEVLAAVSHPNPQDIIAKYGADAMWWHNPQFYEDAFVHWADTSGDGKIDKSELETIFSKHEGLASMDADKIISSFAADGAALTGPEFASFMWHLFHGELKYILGPEPDAELIQDVYEEYQEAKAEAARVLAYMDHMDTSLDLIKASLTTLITPPPEPEPVDPVVDWHPMVKTAQIGTNLCNNFENDALDELKANTDPTKVPHISRIDLMADTNYQYMAGF